MQGSVSRDFDQLCKRRFDTGITGDDQD
jgi:hypothetical protein